MTTPAIEAFFADPPLLHYWPNQKQWNTGGFSGPSLRELHALVLREAGERPRICETGAGNTTIAMLLAQPAELVSIAPRQDLFDRILAYCDSRGISTTSLTPCIERSEVALPPLAAREIAADTWFDVGIIDGGHGWPTVFVDFCYLHAILRPRGLLLVDDIQLHSVGELARFLQEDPGVELVQTLEGGKALVFRKLRDQRFLPDFGGQPYIQRMSRRDAPPRAEV